MYLRVFQHQWMTLERLPLAEQFCNSVLRDDAHVGRTFSWTFRFHQGAAGLFLPHPTFLTSRHQILVSLHGMLRFKLVLRTSFCMVPPQATHLFPSLFHLSFSSSDYCTTSVLCRQKQQDHCSHCSRSLLLPSFSYPSVKCFCPPICE